MGIFPLSYKAKLGLVILGLIIWSIPCYLSIVSPKIHALKKESQILSTKQRSLSDLRNHIEELDRQQQNSQAGVICRRRIFTAQELPGFIQDINSMAQLTKADITKVDISRYMAESASASMDDARMDLSSAVSQVKNASATIKNTSKEGEQDTGSSSGIEPVPLKMSIQGNFKQIYSMLRLLENYDHLMLITGLEAKPVQGRYPTLEMTVPIEVYVTGLPQKNSSKSAEKADNP